MLPTKHINERKKKTSQRTFVSQDVITKSIAHNNPRKYVYKSKCKSISPAMQSANLGKLKNRV